ncbi:hypothetical protein GCM10017044_08000 [Kordiimonas sediminis]|uniref:EAL domain-containing protein n=1 Tax=Kordiimonas sediminis TaxID=1735581 RepID=A0A919APV9_9PROT|nr:hypothetical protein [Kordiimonas sediminis]GHF16129.1 hypothetical protein GCM10017044_08000 [Kordiimonas sediminis]
MSRPGIVQDLKEYLASLKQHRSGRIAVHLRISGLERHLKQQSYRIAAAAHLKPLIDKYSARTFTLENGDIFLITNGASIANINNTLWNLRDEYKESSFLQSVQFEPGQDNVFVGWYPLEDRYDLLMEVVGALARGEAAPQVSSAGNTVSTPAAPRSVQSGSGDGSFSRRPKMIKLLPIDPPSKDEKTLTLDPNLFMTISKALHGVDVAGMIRKQTVAVRTPKGDQAPVMVHRFIPIDTVFEQLLDGAKLIPNRWLVGYLRDYLSDRILSSQPNLYNDGSLASSLSVTSGAILGKAFEPFCRSLGNQSRSTVILQFDIRDAISSPSQYLEAVALATEQGFRTSIAGIDVVSLHWLAQADLNANFIKIEFPKAPMANWLTKEIETSIKRSLDHNGVARFILDCCDTEESVQFAQRVGINLFQGNVISPVTI